MQTSLAVSRFLLSRRARKLSPDTIRWYKGILTDFNQTFPRLPGKLESLEDYFDALKCGDERCAGYYRAVHALYRFLQRRRMIKYNPMEMADMPARKKKLPHFLTADQLDQLLRYPHIFWMKAVLLFLADTGCRVGEVLSLYPESFIETPQGWVAYVNGKTGEREVPLGTDTATAIMKYVPINYSRWWLSRKISRAFKEAHVPGSGRVLRHTFGTLWTGDLMDLQRIMGHSKPQTTEIYRHLNIERLCEQHHQHSPLRQVLTATRRML